MQKVFLSHSSIDKESYVKIVAKKLIKHIGEENVIMDDMTFQEGMKTIDEIERSLMETDLFVVFLSDTSLVSEWVQHELFRAEELWNQKKLDQICPIIISEDITYEDYRIPEWLKENYNMHFISRPSKAEQIIRQRMIELSFEKHPRLRERKNIFVGRNEQINYFEERMDDFEKCKPVCIVASGIMSVGRKTLLRHCIFKSNIKKTSYPFPEITLNYDESIEDFILKIYDFGFGEEMNLDGMLTKTMDEKIQIAIGLISTLQKNSDICFIEDKGSIINQEGTCAKWFTDIISDSTINTKLTICISSRYKLHSFSNDVSWETKDRIYSIDVSELTKKERNGLLNRDLEFEKIQLDINDMRLISGLLSGFPEQVFYSVQMIKDKGIDYLRDNTFEIVEYNNKKASILLREDEVDSDKRAMLALLSSFDCVSLKMIKEIVDSDTKYMSYIDEFISKSLCEYVGALKEYIRVNDTVKDYINRNNYRIHDVHKKNMDKNLQEFLKSCSMNEYDVPEYLFSLKEAMITGKQLDEKFLVPSLYLKTMTELYNKRKNKEVITFADKALEHENYIEPRIAYEIRYLLCSALAKLKNKRFSTEVKKISDPANKYFLWGFYYRQIGKFDKAIEKLDKSIECRPNFSKTKREKVQVYIAMQEFQAAKTLAEENYRNFKDNAYHIQAFFSCLIRSEKSKDNKEMLIQLLDDLKSIDSEVAKEMSLRCEAQFEAFYNDSRERAISLIDKAIEMNPNIQYARLVKFDICERFEMLDEMKEILAFFEQSEYRTKYQNNIIMFKSILLAKEDSFENAEEFFRKNIKDYTSDAVDKFVNRLERISEEIKNIKEDD